MPRKSLLPSVTIPKVTLVQFLREKSSRFDNSVFLVDGTSEREYTFGNVWELGGRVASGLIQNGLRTKDVVASVMRNDPHFTTSMLGTIRAGGIWSSANPAYTAYELEYHFKDCNAAFVITMADLLPVVREASSRCGSVLKIFVVGEDFMAGVSAQERPFAELISYPAFEGFVDTPTEDICILPYSSGTTGVSKGVMLTHRNIGAALCMLQGGDKAISPTSTDVFAAVLPFYHIYGCLSMLSSFIYGHKQIVLAKFEPRQYLRTIEKYKVTILHTVPPIVVFLTKHPMVSEYDLSSVRVVLCGAAPLGVEVISEFRSRFPRVQNLLQGYGMTECPLAPIIPAPSYIPVKIGSCGQIAPNYEAKVMSLDGTMELRENADGEIYVRGPSVMKGYLNQLDATRDTITPDGWLKTGDIGHYDEDGLFYIIDRKKELIKVKGLQVPPAELENVLLSHPDVADAAVIGIPDERSGEVPKGFVVRKSERSSLTENKLLEYVRGRVAHYKQLSSIEFLEQIPKSPSGKILRRILREEVKRSTSKL